MNKKLLFALTSLAIMTLMLVGCGPPSEFAPPRKGEAYSDAVAHICEGEIDPDVVSRLQAYVPSDGINKIALFKEDEDGNFRLGSGGPQEWHVNSRGVWSVLETKELELVACVLWVESELKDTCRYVNAANQMSMGTIKTYNVTRQIVLYEASTGEIIGTSPLIYSSPRKCPSTSSLDAGEVDYYYGYAKEDDLINFLQPFVEP
jgi:hypothetical protein